MRDGCAGSRITRSKSITRVEGAAGADPMVHRLALGFAFRREVAGLAAPSNGSQRAAVDFQPTLAHTFDDLPVTGDDVVRRDHLVGQTEGARQADVVDARQQDHPLRTRRVEHVAVEPGLRVRADEIEQGAVSAMP